MASTILKTTPKSTECVRIVEVIRKENPLLVEDAHNRIKKYEPHFLYLVTMGKIFDKFLKKRGLLEEQIQGVHIPSALVYERTLFISLILWLYSPSVYNKDSDFPIENGVRHELQGLLLCNKEWISQQVKKVSFDYRKNYKDFKDTLDELLDYIKENVKEGFIEQEVEPEPLTMFQ